MPIKGDTSLSSFSGKELAESSAIHGDFNQASINYSGHQNLEVRGAEDMDGRVVNIVGVEDKVYVTIRFPDTNEHYGYDKIFVGDIEELKEACVMLPEVIGWKRSSFGAEAHSKDGGTAGKWKAKGKTVYVDDDTKKKGWTGVAQTTRPTNSTLIVESVNKMRGGTYHAEIDAQENLRLTILSFIDDSWDKEDEEAWRRHLNTYDTDRKKAQVLDKIMAWHDRMQLQSDGIAYELDRMEWMLENPDKDYDDYDDYAESFDADWDVSVDKVTHQKQTFHVKDKDYESQAKRKALSLAKKKKGGWKNYPEGAGFATPEYEVWLARRARAESFGAEYGKRQRFGNRYIARDTKGRIISNVSVGRSLKADRRNKSKTPARSGFGHKGDSQKGASGEFKLPTDAKSLVGIGAVLGGLWAYLESKA